MIPPDSSALVDERKAALQAWLVRARLCDAPVRVETASADASFRRYFRVWGRAGTLIAMDAPPGREDLTPYLRVAELLAAAGLNVPRVLAQDREQGFLLMTDLGSRQYLDELRNGADPDRLYGDAIRALVRIQAGTRGMTGDLPSYDAGRLRGELALFPEWFLGRHLGMTLSDAETRLLVDVSDWLVKMALAQPDWLVHRDYHSRNLMVCRDNPGILDFQDAVVGPQSYDLVSLLKDCYIVWPRPRVLGWVSEYLVAAEQAGIGYPGEARSFIRDFDLMGLQRHLKVLGIFARLWYRDGKRGYLADLPRVLDYALEAVAAEPALAEFAAFLASRVVRAFGQAQAREGVVA